MLDPGTALAVAGMAMDVSKDLLDFLKAWKSCPEDVIELRAAILWLSQTFHLVQKYLLNHKGLRFGQEAAYDTTVINVESCKSKVELLRSALNKVRREKADRTSQKIENELKRFRYFFSKDKIADLFITIKQCEASLHFTISLLQLGTTVNVLDEARSLSSAFATVFHDRDAYLRTEFLSLKNLIQQQLNQSELNRQLGLISNKDKVYQLALTWLVPPEQRKSMSSSQTTLYRSREFGTGSWLTGGDVFQLWQETPNSCLWFQGPGKELPRGRLENADLKQWDVVRVFCDVIDEPHDILIYHYFSYTEDFLQLAEPMIRSLIAQLSLFGSTEKMIVDYYARYNRTFIGEDPSLNELTTFLSQLLQVVSIIGESAAAEPQSSTRPLQRQIFVVFDALDEIPYGKQRDDVLEVIHAIRSLSLANIHLLLTSRAGVDEQDIASMLDLAIQTPQEDIANLSLDDREGENPSPSGGSTARPQLVKYVVSVENIKADVDLVVQKELRTHRRLKVLSPEVKKCVLNMLAEQGQPNFRKVALQVTKLTSTPLSPGTTETEILGMLEIPTIATIRPTISTAIISTQLDDQYRQLLDSIPANLRGAIRRALQWLVYSRRSLSVDEFIEICAFRQDEAGYLTFREDQRKPQDQLLNMLTGLVKVQSTYQILQSKYGAETRVSLDHLSVREYLLRNEQYYDSQHKDTTAPSVAHQVIAESCIRYLMYCNSWKKRDIRYGLRDYAWNYWSWHCARVRPINSSTSNVEDALRDMSMNQDAGDWHLARRSLECVLWALIGMECFEYNINVTESLGVPYFYPEFNIEYAQTIIDFSYKHTYLRDPANQIRIVRLLPGNDENSELRAAIQNVNSLNEESYEVVTYMWNPSKRPAVLRINGMYYGIPSGLAQVLRKLRRRGEEGVRNLWIDAVSINMRDLEEKQIMVGRLPDIFRASTSHAIFADTTTKEEDGEALCLLRKLDQILDESLNTESERRRQLQELVETHRLESLLMSLFDRRIWTRIWPLQEMVLSKESTIFYGDQQIQTTLLERVLKSHELLESVTYSVHKIDADAGLAQNRTWRSVIEMMSLRAAVRDGFEITVLRALYASRYLQYHDPKDRIYGIMALFHPSSLVRSRIAIDYSFETSLRQLFVQLGALILRLHRNLDMFSLISHKISKSPDYQLYPTPEPLPSWVTTCTFDEHETAPLITAAITYPVVKDVFSAGGDATLNVKFRGYLDSKDILRLDGTFIDCILYIYPPMEAPTFTHALAQRRGIFSDGHVQPLISQNVASGETIISTYWRCVCANQTRVGSLIAADGALNCGSISLPRTEADESSWDPKLNDAIALKFSRGRRFFITQRGRMGLGPITSAVGDVLAIFPSGKVPYVLRQSDDASEDVPPYQLIGDSYVHGIMHGELANFQDNPRIRTVVIE